MNTSDIFRQSRDIQSHIPWFANGLRCHSITHVSSDINVFINRLKYCVVCSSQSNQNDPSCVQSKLIPFELQIVGPYLWGSLILKAIINKHALSEKQRKFKFDTLQCTITFEGLRLRTSNGFCGQFPGLEYDRRNPLKSQLETGNWLSKSPRRWTLFKWNCWLRYNFVYVYLSNFPKLFSEFTSTVYLCIAEQDCQVKKSNFES